MSKKEDLIAAQKKLAEQLKKQKETGKVDPKKLKQLKNKEFIEPLKTAPKEKAMGGKIQTEYRNGGMVNLGNYKGQF